MKWIATLLLIMPAIALAETEPEFHLCAPYAQASAVGEKTERGWPVFVTLTESGTRSFQQFTETNAGRMTQIVVGGREFLRATIWVPPTHGRLKVIFTTEKIATSWHRTLETKLAPAPCGAKD